MADRLKKQAFSDLVGALAKQPLIFSNHPRPIKLSKIADSA
jgi:hypothetical protein